MSTHGGDFSGSANRYAGKRHGGLHHFSSHTELLFPWMKTFAREADKIEERKRLIKDLCEKEPKRYGFLVCEFMDGVCVPLHWKLNDLVSKNDDVWSRECVEDVHRVTARACQLLLYPVPQVSEMCSLAECILADFENQEGRVVELQEMVKIWVKHGAKVIPSSC